MFQMKIQKGKRNTSFYPLFFQFDLIPLQRGTIVVTFLFCSETQKQIKKQHKFQQNISFSVLDIIWVTLGIYKNKKTRQILVKSSFSILEIYSDYFQGQQQIQLIQQQQCLFVYFGTTHRLKVQVGRILGIYIVQTMVVYLQPEPNILHEIFNFSCLECVVDNNNNAWIKVKETIRKLWINRLLCF
eukprot:TRINITY_DN18603_c0_g1_i2.p2 TRINITY_DN18603_c0_g1~~TRINITY_DN18603_c0_g1_i2.p2  ORF type:complete len:186 (-),score=-0.44 TRINITY_DN18603_c0_g1_i2:168-725(-)